MITEVAAKYKLVGITQGKHSLQGIGIVDFTTMTLPEADALYQLKVPFLVKITRAEKRNAKKPK